MKKITMKTKQKQQINTDTKIGYDMVLCIWRIIKH
jgi:hypothetical protein